MERRLLLAILLTFLVLTVYQWMLPKPPPTAPSATSGPGAGPAATPAQAGASSPTPPPIPLPPVEQVLGDTAEKTIEVDNGVVHAVFSNRGGTVSSWQLLDYRDEGGRPLDLVPHDVGPDVARPFALKLDDPAKSRRVNEAFYSLPAAVGSSIDARQKPAAFAFEYQDATGIHVRKQFRIDPGSYVVDFAVLVSDGGRLENPVIQWGPGLGDVQAMAPSGRNVRHPQGIFDLAGTVHRQSASVLQKTPRYEGHFAFAGVDTHYFISVAVQPGSAVIEYQPLSIPVAGSNPPISRDYVAYQIRYASPPSGARFFFGPKKFETLKATDSELVRAIWFGMFAFLSVPLLPALNWVNGFIGNYGWSIVVLTVLINAAMFPLRHKAFVSMRKMQEIQPLVKQIQDRYAKLKMTDPARQKMNTELMDLYRSKGVNPAGGCIPMLLPLPILFAFYSLLSEAIELRGAPFMLWIKDLSLADPYYVTPILMGISHLAQQKMAPAAADRAQQNMMLIMPVMFTFFFLTSPSGLALYWFASNVLLIGQQALTNYLIGPPNVRVPRPPAERRVKKAEAVDLEN